MKYRFRVKVRNALLLIFIFGAMLLAAGQASSQCTCAEKYVNITARDEFKLADAVFVGKVMAIARTPRDKNGVYVETVTFRVTAAWKRDLDSSLTITNTIQGCLNGFEENSEWLVYAYLSKNGTLGTHCCCSRTALLAKAGEDLKTFADDPKAKVLTASNQKSDDTDGIIFLGRAACTGHVTL